MQWGDYMEAIMNYLPLPPVPPLMHSQFVLVKKKYLTSK